MSTHILRVNLKLKSENHQYDIGRQIQNCECARPLFLHSYPVANHQSLILANTIPQSYMCAHICSVLDDCCRDPPLPPHTSIALLNGSTQWRARAIYSCLPGYNPTKGRSRNLPNISYTCCQCVSYRFERIFGCSKKKAAQSPGGGSEGIK